MKRLFMAMLTVGLAFGLSANGADAAKREKFGVDVRHKEAKRVNFKPSQ